MDRPSLSRWQKGEVAIHVLRGQPAGGSVLCRSVWRPQGTQTTLGTVPVTSGFADRIWQRGSRRELPLRVRVDSAATRLLGVEVEPFSDGATRNDHVSRGLVSDSPL